MFQKEFNTLLDICIVSCKTLLSLKAIKKKENDINWSMDNEFFKGQLKHPQTTSMWNITISFLDQHIRMREEKAAKTLAYIKKNLRQFKALRS